MEQGTQGFSETHGGALGVYYFSPSSHLSDSELLCEHRLDLSQDRACSVGTALQKSTEHRGAA